MVKLLKLDNISVIKDRNTSAISRFITEGNGRGFPSLKYEEKLRNTSIIRTINKF